jgi:hypothetical protein
MASAIPAHGAGEVDAQGFLNQLNAITGAALVAKPGSAAVPVVEAKTVFSSADRAGSVITIADIDAQVAKDILPAAGCSCFDESEIKH